MTTWRSVASSLPVSSVPEASGVVIGGEDALSVVAVDSGPGSVHRERQHRLLGRDVPDPCRAVHIGNNHMRAVGTGAALCAFASRSRVAVARPVRTLMTCADPVSPAVTTQRGFFSVLKLTSLSPKVSGQSPRDIVTPGSSSIVPPFRATAS